MLNIWKKGLNAVLWGWNICVNFLLWWKGLQCALGWIARLVSSGRLFHSQIVFFGNALFLLWSMLGFVTCELLEKHLHWQGSGWGKQGCFSLSHSCAITRSPLTLALAERPKFKWDTAVVYSCSCSVPEFRVWLPPPALLTAQSPTAPEVRHVLLAKHRFSCAWPASAQALALSCSDFTPLWAVQVSVLSLTTPWTCAPGTVCCS